MYNGLSRSSQKTTCTSRGLEGNPAALLVEEVADIVTVAFL